MKLSKRILSAIIALIMFLSSSSVVLAENKSQGEEKVLSNSSEELSDYLSYLNKNSNYTDAKSDITVEMDRIIAENSNVSIENSKDTDSKSIVNFTESGDTAAFEFDAEEMGFYNLQLEFMYLDDGVADLEIAVTIDDEVYFNDMNNFKIPRLWKNSSDKWMTDDKGNQYSSEQIEVKGYNKVKLYDRIGVATEPFRFALSKGKHTISITVTKQDISLSEISFTAPEQLMSYHDVSSEYSKKGYKNYSGDDIVIQGEDADIKNSFSIIGKSDNLSPEVIPCNAKNTVVNYIGSSNWSAAGESILWNFVAPKSGLYEICFHYKQSTVVNGSVYRWLKIDGKTPFKEASSIRFNYSTSWDSCTLVDSDGNNCKVYLEEGQHTIEMAVTVGEMSNYYIKLKEIVDSIANEYLKIAMITGESPDSNRDYELFRQIPNLETVFNENIEKIAELATDMKSMSEKSSTQYVSSLNAMSRVLSQMVETKYLAHTYKSDLYNQYCTLSSMLYEMLVMPLSLDEIRLYQPDKKIDYNVSFFDSVKYGVLKFLYSFVSDYSTETKDEESITLWLNWGRDQTQILKTLIQESFTPKTGVKVNVKITGATIIQGMLTNNAPDVAIGVSRANPVNYAMRGAVYDLRNFEDFDSVIERFNNGATDPYSYKNGVYALPDTQNFFVMFYRTDILKNLGVSVPKTWEEFIEVTSVIQRNKMNVYLPYTKLDAATTVNSGIGGLNLFATLMTQNNLDFYDISNYNCLLDDDSVIDLFDRWTQYYTKYKIPTESNFYNRFRIGVSPLGIAPYSTYTTLDVAAPEIKGKWGISLIPGMVQSDGSIDHGCAGSGTACIILNDSNNKDNAWRFLKWWTSADTQLSYSRNVESIIGPTGRIATSNKEAFLNYSWNDNDLDVLMEQWSYVEEIPEVPGSYYLVRAVDQAFWTVVNSKSNASDAMIKWNAVANDEIKRKVEEYKADK